MVKIWGGKEDMDKWKPEGLKDYYTISEVAKVCNRTVRRIKQVEQEGKLPIPIRANMGEINYRLYSPTQLETIKRHFASTRPGYPAGTRGRKNATNI